MTALLPWVTHMHTPPSPGLGVSDQDPHPFKPSFLLQKNDKNSSLCKHASVAQQLPAPDPALYPLPKQLPKV